MRNLFEFPSIEMEFIIIYNNAEDGSS
jgi:hypothetical protein